MAAGQRAGRPPFGRAPDRGQVDPNARCGPCARAFARGSLAVPAGGARRIRPGPDRHGRGVLPAIGRGCRQPVEAYKVRRPEQDDAGYPLPSRGEPAIAGRGKPAKRWLDDIGRAAKKFRLDQSFGGYQRRRLQPISRGVGRFMSRSPPEERSWSRARIRDDHRSPARLNRWFAHSTRNHGNSANPSRSWSRHHVRRH